MALFVLGVSNAMGHYDRCPAGRGGEPHAHAQSVQSSVVFSWIAGDAGLLRSLECRRSITEPDYRRLDGHSLYRHQSEGQRLLLFQRSKVGDPDVSFSAFMFLWVTMIMIGTFFRGPGWNLFWPWQRWDPAQSRRSDQRRFAVSFWL